MTIQPDEELHVIPTAGAPGTAGAGFRVIDRTDATDEEFRARVAVFDAAEEPEEVVVERVTRALWEADNDLNPVADRGFLWSLMESHGIADRYRRLAAAAIAAEEAAHEVDCPSCGATIRARMADADPSPAEQAVKRVEALAESFDATSALRRALALADELESPRIGADPIATRARRDVAKRLRAALASPAPAPQGDEGGAWRWYREPGTGDEWEQVWTCCGGPFSERPSGHYVDCPAIGGCSR